MKNSLNLKYNIYDISQPVGTSTAAFPGDCQFSFNQTLELAKNNSVNLTSFQMSPHVGTHVDAYSHVISSIADKSLNAGQIPLYPFIGQALVIDLAPVKLEISLNNVKSKLEQFKNIPERVLIKTNQVCQSDFFDKEFAYLTPQIVDELNMHNVKLVGIDSPSVDKFDSKKLIAHFRLIDHSMYWIENLNLATIPEGYYFMCAAPINLVELEAAPIRAVLLDFEEN